MNGKVIGTLMGFGLEEKTSTDFQKETLVSLSEIVLKLTGHKELEDDHGDLRKDSQFKHSLKCVISDDGEFKLLKPIVKSISGKDEDSLKRNIATLIHLRDLELAVNEFQKLNEKEKDLGFTGSLITKTNESIWFDIRIGDSDDGLLDSEIETVQSLPEFRILLVEDNEHLQLLSQLHLEREKWKVDVASNGLEAIDLVRKYKYDVILMDSQMPQMSGIQATRYMRDELNLRTPIIGISASSDKQSSNEFSAAGLSDFLAKPFSISELLKKVKSHVYQEHLASDWDEAFESLVMETDPELIKKFVQIFRDRIPADIKELEAFTANGEYELLGKKAHFLCSTFQSMHLKGGIKIARDLMKITSDKLDAQITSKSDHLINYLKETHTLITEK